MRFFILTSFCLLVFSPQPAIAQQTSVSEIIGALFAGSCINPDQFEDRFVPQLRRELAGDNPVTACLSRLSSLRFEQRQRPPCPPFCDGGSDPVGDMAQWAADMDATLAGRRNWKETISGWRCSLSCGILPGLCEAFAPNFNSFAAGAARACE